MYSYANHFYFSNTYHKLKAPYQGVLIIARSAIITVTLAKKNWEGKTYISQLELNKASLGLNKITSHCLSVWSLYAFPKELLPLLKVGYNGGGGGCR